MSTRAVSEAFKVKYGIKFKAPLRCTLSLLIFDTLNHELDTCMVFVMCVCYVVMMKSSYRFLQKFSCVTFLLHTTTKQCPMLSYIIQIIILSFART